jgi:hypothetical protein
MSRLTPQQRKILSAMPRDGSFVDYRKVMVRRDTRIKLTNGGWTEPYRAGAVTVYSNIRLTEKGLAVAKACDAT